VFSIPPKSLQNALIFYLICIIVVTNGFFAIVTLSRENILFYQEAVNRSIFWGNILLEPAKEFFLSGSSVALDRIYSFRNLGMDNVKVTLYDRNWWRKWGDPPRIPPEGFPASIEKGGVTFRSGVTGESSREIYFHISSGSEWLGTLGVGVPEFGSAKVLNAIKQVVLTTLANIFLGVALAVFIAQIILRPLLTLLDGLEAIKRGDYGNRVQISGEGEMAALGQMFNTMAASLQEKIRENLDRTRVLDEKVQELWEIYELTKAMGFSLHLQQILEKFMEKALTLSFSSFGQILLNVSEGNRLEVKVRTPTFPSIPTEVFDRCLSRCLAAEETIEEKVQGLTLLSVPLMSGRLVQGILFLGKQGEQSFSEGIKRFLETISPLGGSLIENAKLYQHVVEMKDYVQNVLDSVDSGLVTIDRDGKIVTVNKAFVNLFGLTGFQPVGKPVTSFLSEINDSAFAESFEKMALGKFSKSGSTSGSFMNRQELTFCGKDGVSRIILLRWHR